jgi:hypothetical protein
VVSKNATTGASSSRRFAALFSTTRLLRRYGTEPLAAREQVATTITKLQELLKQENLFKQSREALKPTETGARARYWFWQSELSELPVFMIYA